MPGAGGYHPGPNLPEPEKAMFRLSEFGVYEWVQVIPDLPHS